MHGRPGGVVGGGRLNLDCLFVSPERGNLRKITGFEPVQLWTMPGNYCALITVQLVLITEQQSGDSATNVHSVTF